MTFESDIRPLLKARCFSCHGEGEATEAGLDVRLVHQMKKGGDSGPAIVAGNRNESPLYQRLSEGDMPPGDLPRLTSSQVELIGKWIDSGARTARAEPESPHAEKITPEERQFWSFQPLKTPTIPAPPNTRSGSGPIDAFVLQRLDELKLAPSEQADPRMLLRRLSFVLTGLPPTYEQVRDFEQNPSDENYAAHVDDLLASPQFGERWGRFWLDLVRYVDVMPSYLYKTENAWRYRDWVIRSFNEDRPYDEFLQLQLAADLIPESKPEDLAALGLLGLSPVYWKELKLAPEVIRVTVADEWDERIDVVSRTFLGLSVACARCHDHKFDPIPASDYYALAGVIASTQQVEKPMLPPGLCETTYLARKQVDHWNEELKALPKETPESQRDLLRAKIAALIESTPEYDAPTVNIVEDARVEVVPNGSDATKIVMHRGMSTDLPVFRRGNPEDQGAIVPRHFLSVLSEGEPVAFQQGSGRLELTEAILDEGQALSSRVMVNRIWGQVFGQGLVRTVSDFGAQGDRPTHPELLDYLAVRFVRQGWSMKSLIREMVLSETFRQTSHLNKSSAEKDPSGQWLSHVPRRQLEIEGWRDSLLKTTGQLDLKAGGPALPLDDPAFRRRTVYAKIVREDLNNVLRLFDFPEGLAHSPCRDKTITPMQQLYVLNGPLLDQLAKAAVERLFKQPGESSDEARIIRCYQGLYQRSPSEFEITNGLEFLKLERTSSDSEEVAWESYVHILLSLNEMAFLD